MGVLSLLARTSWATIRIFDANYSAHHVRVLFGDRAASGDEAFPVLALNGKAKNFAQLHEVFL